MMIDAGRKLGLICVVLLLVSFAYAIKVDSQRQTAGPALSASSDSADVPVLLPEAGLGPESPAAPAMAPSSARPPLPEARSLTVDLEPSSFRYLSIRITETPELNLSLSKAPGAGPVSVYLLAPDGRLLEGAHWPEEDGQVTWSLKAPDRGNYLLLGSPVPQKVAVASSHPLQLRGAALEGFLQGGKPFFYVLDNSVATKFHCSIATSGKGLNLRADLYSPEDLYRRYDGSGGLNLKVDHPKPGKWLLVLHGRFSPTQQVQFTLACPQTGLYRLQPWELHPLVPGGKEQAVYSFESSSAGGLLVHLRKPEGVSEVQAYLTYSGGAPVAQDANWDIARPDTAFYLASPSPGGYRITLMSPVGQPMDIYAVSPDGTVRGVGR